MIAGCCRKSHPAVIRPLSLFADIDECTSPDCDTNAECTNTEGSYTCSCRVGYTGDGKTCAGNFIVEFAAISGRRQATCLNWILQFKTTELRLLGRKLLLKRIQIISSKLTSRHGTPVQR